MTFGCKRRPLESSQSSFKTRATLWRSQMSQLYFMRLHFTPAWRWFLWADACIFRSTYRNWYRLYRSFKLVISHTSTTGVFFFIDVFQLYLSARLLFKGLETLWNEWFERRRCRVIRNVQNMFLYSDPSQQKAIVVGKATDQIPGAYQKQMRRFLRDDV